MEKYMKYADKSTQINPFLPEKSSTRNVSNSAGNRKRIREKSENLGSQVGGVFFLLLRLPPLAVVGLVGYLISTFFAPLPLLLCGSLGLFQEYQYRKSLSAKDLEDMYAEVYFFTNETWAFLSLIVLGFYFLIKQAIDKRKISQPNDQTKDLQTYSIIYDPIISIFIKGLSVISGVIFIERLANIRRLGLASKNMSSSINKSSIFSIFSPRSMKSGDIILANHNSPLDVLFLTYKYSSPMFLQLNDGKNHNNVKVVSAQEALLHNNNLDLIRRTNGQQEKKEIESEGNSVHIHETNTDWLDLLTECKKKGKALVINPEVIATNGLGIFQFLTSLESIPSQVFSSSYSSKNGTTKGSSSKVSGKSSSILWVPQIHILTFSRVSSTAPPVPSQNISSTLSFFVTILSAIRTTILVTYLCPEYAPQLEKTTSGTKWSRQVRDLFSQMIEVPKLESIDYKSLERFVFENFHSKVGENEKKKK